MAFTDSLPIAAAGYNSSDGSSSSQCQSAGSNMLTDNGTAGIIQQIEECDGSVAISDCYAPNEIEVTRFSSITIPDGATITGVRFTVEANGVLTDASDALQYKISVNNGTDFTTAAALDLTGINNTKGGLQEFHTTSSETELHGLTWPTSDSGYDSPDVRFRFTLNGGEANCKILQIDFIKLRIYYTVPSRPTYENGSDEQVVSLGTLILGSGEITF